MGPLSAMERLSIASFIANGHAYHLYSYDELENVPRGAVLKDAREVLPADWLFLDSRGTYAGFSNAFRYKLLLDRGGWWVDTDMVCLRPLDFSNEYVFAREPDFTTIGSGAIRVPTGSAVMRYAWDRVQAFRPRRRPFRRKRHPWGATGPALLGEAVEAHELSDRAMEPAVFNPVDWTAWEDVLKPDGVAQFGEETRTVHLWSAMWAVARRDKNATYPQGCLYEQLKRRYLGSGLTSALATQASSS
jgi:hypothetical protein